MYLQIERRAAMAGCTHVEIEVVNHRLDVLPWYLKLGYVAVSEAPFPAPERVTIPTHFIVLRKALG